MLNRNSACIWLPKIEGAGLPCPKTIMIPYDHRACLSVFDGEESVEFDRICGEVEKAVELLGTAAFIRTDLTSAKHSGPRAYLTDGVSRESILRTIEDTEMKTWLEWNGPQAIMVRQFLHLEASFTGFNGLPIAREWRFFADQERVICYHPYWPAEALEGHVDESENPHWRTTLADMHIDSPEIQELKLMAVKAAQACGSGQWSVDFAKDIYGKWWLPDMATAKDSYHWPGCTQGEIFDAVSITSNHAKYTRLV